MASNKQLTNKADLALADLASNNGLLNPEQDKKFILTLMNEPTILNSARVVTMNGPQKIINKMGIGSRILRPAVSSQRLAQADRTKPDLGSVTLNTKEVIAELLLPYDVIEDNIEGGSIGTPMGSSPGGIADSLLALIASRTALDLEELFLLGDTASADTYLKLLDGWMKLCATHQVDAANTAIGKAVFKAGVKAMPDKYLRDRSALRHFISVDNETDYRDEVSDRNTAGGDNALTGNSPLFVHGSPIIGASMMPATKGLYTDPRNLIMGIQRRINIEWDKDIGSRTYQIVVTMRVDAKVEEVDAAVRTVNLLAA